MYRPQVWRWCARRLYLYRLSVRSRQRLAGAICLRQSLADIFVFVHHCHDARLCPSYTFGHGRPRHCRLSDEFLPKWPPRQKAANPSRHRLRGSGRPDSPPLSMPLQNQMDRHRLHHIPASSDCQNRHKAGEYHRGFQDDPEGNPLFKFLSYLCPVFIQNRRARHRPVCPANRQICNIDDFISHLHGSVLQKFMFGNFFDRV